jgi:transcriptional regulator with XRE-family HTH domain
MIEARIATQIRRRRQSLGLTQKDVGDRLGISHQAVQKIETTMTRITVGRLWELAQVLDVPVDYFFDGLGPKPGWGDQRMIIGPVAPLQPNENRGRRPQAAR